LLEEWQATVDVASEVGIAIAPRPRLFGLLSKR
jgi:hypothetical protein